MRKETKMVENTKHPTYKMPEECKFYKVVGLLECCMCPEAVKADTVFCAETGKCDYYEEGVEE